MPTIRLDLNVCPGWSNQLMVKHGHVPDDRAYGGNGHDQLVELQAVQHRGLPRSVQTHHDDLALLVESVQLS